MSWSATRSSTASAPRRYTYVEYGTGERELYDLEKDPFQLANQARTADPALLQAFAAAAGRAQELRLDQLPDA